MSYFYEKGLCVFAVFVLVLLAALEFHEADSQFSSVASFLLPIHISIGSWFVLDDKEKGLEVNILDLYVWPIRLIRKFRR